MKNRLPIRGSEIPPSKGKYWKRLEPCEKSADWHWRRVWYIWQISFAKLTNLEARIEPAESNENCGKKLKNFFKSKKLSKKNLSAKF